MARERTQQRKRPGTATGPVKRRNCYFCKEKVAEIDYKNVNQLRRYISEKGKIRSRRITGACRRHQVQIAQADVLDVREEDDLHQRSPRSPRSRRPRPPPPSSEPSAT